MTPYWLVINSDFHTTEPYALEQICFSNKNSQYRKQVFRTSAFPLMTPLDVEVFFVTSVIQVFM